MPTLEEQQASQFAEQGWTVVDALFCTAEVDELRQILRDPPFAERSFSEDQAVHFLNITTLHPRFLELAKDPRITERITPLLGPNIQLHHSKTCTKPSTPGTGEFKWHQDFAYYPHTNADVLAVMIMLDDATPENGCMFVVPGSHKLGLRNHHNDSGYWAGECVERELYADTDALVPLTPKAGGISIHHGLTLHGSGVNLSGAPRRGIVFAYRAADAYCLADNLWADSGLQVCGKRSDQVRCDATHSNGMLQLPTRLETDEARPNRHGDLYRQQSDFALAHNAKL